MAFDSKAYYEAHKEERKAYTKAYGEAHKEEIKASKKVYGEAHTEERKARSKAYAETHRAQLKLAYIRRTYGLSPEAYFTLIKLADGRCSICGKKTKLHIDHCHAKGCVRGLLCPQCNRGLGNFKDNPATLAKAIQYLETNLEGSLE
jgi:hypothetical protein